MTDVTFTDGLTAIEASWLNPINEFYNDVFDGAVTKAQAADAINAVDGAQNATPSDGEVYKGLDGATLELRTLTAGSTNISITTNVDDITIDVPTLGAQTTSNVGAGAGVAKARVGDDFPFKSIVGGTNITAVPNTNDVTLNVDSVTSASNSGLGDEGLFKARVGDDLEFKELVGGTNNTLTSDADTITIEVDSVTGGSNTGASGAEVFKERNADNLDFRKLVAGAQVTISESVDAITISSTGTPAAGAADLTTFDPSTNVLTAGDVQAAIEQAVPVAWGVVEAKAGGVKLSGDGFSLTTSQAGFVDITLDSAVASTDNMVVMTNAASGITTAATVNTSSTLTIGQYPNEIGFTGTILAAATTRTITISGMSGTPSLSKININLTGSLGSATHWWIDNAQAGGQFDVNVDAAPGIAVDFIGTLIGGEFSEDEFSFAVYEAQ